MQTVVIVRVLRETAIPLAPFSLDLDFVAFLSRGSPFTDVKNRGGQARL